MKIIRCLLLLTGALILIPAVHAEGPVKTKEDALKLVQSLRRRQGEIDLRNGVATLNVPKEFDYLDPEDAQTVLVKLWGNPPHAKILGLLLPADMSPLAEGCWAVTISFVEDGFVRDDDANKINYDDLLKKMKKTVHEANAARQKQGYSSVELIAWAAPPRYDAAAHKLYWAKELQFGGSEERTLNYDIRILGRRGILVLNAVASMDKLETIQKEAPGILAMVNFKKGHAYSDFDPKLDKVATYGIAALVAGGIAAKLGLFKGLLVFLLAAKKFLILGLVAIATFFKKLFSKNKNGPE